MARESNTNTSGKQSTPTASKLTGGQIDSIEHGHRAGDGPRGFMKNDKRLYEEVRERLESSADVDDTLIEVAVDDGNVRLSGVVESEDAKAKVQTLVSEIVAIGDIRNELRVEARPQVEAHSGTSH